MNNTLIRAKRTSFFRAVDAASELARHRSTRLNRFPDPWMGIRASRRDAYLAGEGRMGKELVGRLISAYPETAVIWRTPVWEYLNSDLSDKACANRLYEEFGISRSTTSLEALLNLIAAKDLPTLGDDLTEISRLVLAIRVSRHAKLPGIAIKLAMELAKGLLLLSGCVYRRSLAEQLWTYCGDTLVKDIKHQSQGIFFQSKTWDFIERHSIGVCLKVRLLAYFSPQTKVLPFPFVEELLRDMVDCVTMHDADRAAFVMGRLYSPTHFDHSLQPIPDVEKLSIWQPFAI